MEALTDFPERLVAGKKVFLGAEYTPLVIESIRYHGKLLLVKFENLDYREDVDEFRNQYLHVPTEDRPPLAEGEYYHHQLIGMNVIDENGIHLGHIKSILETGANDVYIIHPLQGPDILLPAIKSVIKEIDLNNNVMRVQIPPGLIPD
jgi:16S rRNA processing protein RimM